MQKILVALAAALALVVAAPVASASDATLPAHDTGMVTCGRNAVSGMAQITTAAPTMRGTSLSSETVGYRPALYRWNGSSWALHRTGSWMTATTSSGGHVTPGPLFGSGQTFGPLGSGYYAVMIQFWWSSTGVVHNDFANEYNGGFASYCLL
jgi:hypothetical protein